ncbi:hypothetical protein BT96DRAFT_989443 [Gymnopus androsaceus JB14]|uniref:Uncharacterized protein n=1 Tax=Gymnopus androsaceus JB14 TaxID=1447944 RepID=A0A6A4HYB6_9AGAR|nr:hypothetical protein BT96DRAFT_989443 [Gymnopus androsaceus JB14]
MKCRFYTRKLGMCFWALASSGRVEDTRLIKSIRQVNGEYHAEQVNNGKKGGPSSSSSPSLPPLPAASLMTMNQPTWPFSLPLFPSLQARIHTWTNFPPFYPSNTHSTNAPHRDGYKSALDALDRPLLLMKLLLGQDLVLPVPKDM